MNMLIYVHDGKRCGNLQSPPPTMLTTMDVVVEELCNNTVASTPIMRPATGLDRILFSLKALPAALPIGSKQKSLKVSCISIVVEYSRILHFKANVAIWVRF